MTKPEKALSSNEFLLGRIRNESPLSFFSLSFFFFFFLGGGGGEGVFFRVIFFLLSSFFQLVYRVTGGPPDNRRMGCEFALLLLFFIHPK